jgi:lipopolysaccharide/colanic/teichoic acid biosynthesis glycosyltransferase
MLKVLVTNVYETQKPKKLAYWASKRSIDIIISLTLLPIMIGIAIFLLFLNYFCNKGTIFYVQKRMGMNCKPFNALKFRTMTTTDRIKRTYHDPLEVERITYLGRILRNLRIDELPQILNVIKGDMSLIGPRPDYYEHALMFLKDIPEYQKRHVIRPGISGLAQIRLGYVEGVNATKKKSKIDIFYIENANFILDLKIFFGTILTVIKGIWVKS